jgi:hypothetical protein
MSASTPKEFMLYSHIRLSAGSTVFGDGVGAPPPLGPSNASTVSGVGRYSDRASQYLRWDVDRSAWPWLWRVQILVGALLVASSIALGVVALSQDRTFQVILAILFLAAGCLQFARGVKGRRGPTGQPGNGARA